MTDKPYIHINFGEPDEGPHERVHHFLMSVLTPLRQEFARRLKLLRRKYPGHKLPCETCAFRSGTDRDPGFEKTIIHFVKALHEDAPFLCHHNMPRDRTGQWRPPMKGPRGQREIDWAKVEYCKAWLVLRSTLPEPFDIHELVPDLICHGIAQMAEVVE